MSADVSCRIAWADDVPAIAAIQAACWRQAYAGVLPAEVLDELDPEGLQEPWRQAVGRPADARQRVLIALERNDIHGFTTTQPSPDPDADAVADGEIGEILIDPQYRRQGHGSRLLQAAVDTLRADRFTRALIWVNATDDELRAFVTDGGFAPDGAHRALDLRGDGQVVVKQVRLHASLT